MSKKFQPLDYSRGWDDYWRDHPQGYSPQEQMINWASQLNTMIDWFNDQLGTDITGIVGDKLDVWLGDGTFNQIINQTIFTDLNNQIDDVASTVTSIDNAIQAVADELVTTNAQIIANNNHLTMRLLDIHINVKDHGVVGDGVTDDTAAIQTILNSTPDSGAIVYFPPGVYKVSQPLIIPYVNSDVNMLRPIHIKGAGGQAVSGNINMWSAGITAFHYVGTSGALFDLRSGTSAQPRFAGVFSDFTAYGDADATNQYNITGLLAYQAVGARFENIGFKNFKTGIQIDHHAYYSKFVDLKLNYNTDHGLVLLNDVNGSIIDGIQASSNGKNAIRLSYYAANTKITNATIENSGSYAIYAANGSQLIIDNCYFEKNYSVLYVGGNASNATIMQNCYMQHEGTFRLIHITDITLFAMINSMVNWQADSSVAGISLGGSTAPRYIGIGNTWLGSTLPNDVPVYQTLFKVEYGKNLLALEKVIAGKGIGVGNAVAATTPGAVSKKMEVFDTSGNSIGFIPIYTSIT